MTATANPLDELERRIAGGEAVIGVIGLGYVGLPLACTIAERGLRAIGFDVDAAKIERIARGESYIKHIPPERLAPIVSAGRTAAALAAAPDAGFAATADFDDLRLCDAILVCVPTPLTEGREPDLSAVVGTSETIAKRLRPGQLIVLESTTYPGTTDEIVRPILEKGGLVVGGDIALAFSPEREDPGEPTHVTRVIPKVVGGVTQRCGRIAAALYGALVDRVVPVSSARVAESAKLLENIFRGVNIALVNELKMLFERMNIDVWEVIDAASSKPFGFMPFYPGPGLGGHCIPIDPFYLTWKARHFDFATRFIELAGEINTGMPYWVVDRLVTALGEHGRALPGAEILVLGVAYKKDVDDLRESPALKLIEILESRGAKVAYHDPFVPTLRTRRLRRYDILELDSVPIDAASLGRYAAVVVATDHSVFDWQAIVSASRLVVDTRNATRRVTSARDKIVLA